MKELIFATNNAHKVQEVAAVLGSAFGIRTVAELGLTDDIPEEQDTLEGNALQKARYVKEHLGLDCFADDTGLEVEALGGAPGVYSARYAGEQRDFAANTAKLLHEMRGVSNRKARFRTVIALIMDGHEYLFEGQVQGTISVQPSGAQGFGYDPVFVPEGCTHSFAEMSLEQKSTMSHRARAVAELAKFLQSCAD